MSRAARAALAEDRVRVAKLVSDAAAHFKEGEAAEPEVPPDTLIAFRAQRVYGLCKTEVVRHHPPLWPPEAVGMGIAEQWLQNLTRRIQEQAVAQMRARADEAGIALPS